MWVYLHPHSNRMSKGKEPETPAQVLGEMEPFAKDLINKMSAKWTKRTQGAVVQWPKGGTFDMDVCEKNESFNLEPPRKRSQQKETGKRSSELMVFKQILCRRA